MTTAAFSKLHRTVAGKPEKLNLAGFEVEIRRKAIRRLNLRVSSADGPLQASLPHSMPLSELERFLEQKRGWITKARARQATRAQAVLCRSAYREGDPVLLWGQTFCLHWDKSAEGIRGQWLVLAPPLQDLPHERERCVYSFYAQEMQRELKKRLPAAAEKLKLPLPRVELRRMTSLWGSCRLKSRSVCFNLELARYPLEILDYLILHELMHFLEASHNARYQRLMDRAMPDWRERRAVLKGS